MRYQWYFNINGIRRKARAQVDQTPRQVQELRSQRVVIEVRDEWVYHSATDRAGQHRCLHPRLGAGNVTDQCAVETRKELLERFMLREEPDDDGIEL